MSPRYAKGAIVKYKDTSDAPWKVLQIYRTAFGPAYAIESLSDHKVLSSVEESDLSYHSANWVDYGHHEILDPSQVSLWNTDGGSND